MFIQASSLFPVSSYFLSKNQKFFKFLSVFLYKVVSLFEFLDPPVRDILRYLCFSLWLTSLSVQISVHPCWGHFHYSLLFYIKADCSWEVCYLTSFFCSHTFDFIQKSWLLYTALPWKQRYMCDFKFSFSLDLSPGVREWDSPITWFPYA